MSRTLIGAVRISLGLQSAQFEANMKKADKTTKEWERSVKRAARQLDRKGRELQKFGQGLTRNVTTPLAAVATGLAALTVQTARYANEIDKASIRTGIGAEKLQEYRFAAGQLGVEFSALERSIDAFRRRVMQIEEGSGRSAEVFQRLGVRLRDSRGELRQMEELFPDVINGLRGITNANERAVLSQQIFGRGASDIIPILEASEEEFNRLTNRAEELGIVMGAESVAEMVKFYDQMDEVRQQAGALGRDFGLVLLPILQDDLLPMLQNRLIPSLRYMAQRFNDMDEGARRTAVTFGIFVAAAGPAITVTGSLLRNLAAIRLVLMANPWAIAATGLIALSGYLASTVLEARRLREELEAVNDIMSAESIDNMGMQELQLLERQYERLSERIREKTAADIRQHGQIGTNVQALLSERAELERRMDELREQVKGTDTLTHSTQNFSSQIIDLGNNYRNARTAAEEFYDTILDGSEDWEDIDLGLPEIFDQDVMDEAQRLMNLFAAGEFINIAALDKNFAQLQQQVLDTWDGENRDAMLEYMAGLREIRSELIGMAGEDLPELEESLQDAIAAAMMFSNALANGLDAAIFRGEKLEQVLRNILRQLSSQMLRNLIMGGGLALATGGSIGLATLFTGMPMATGGTVPPGFPNDTYPAMLSSGEQVIPRPLALGAGGYGGGGAMTVSVPVYMDGREIARGLAKIDNRRNA